MDGRRDGCMDGWMDGCVDGWMRGCMGALFCRMLTGNFCDGWSDALMSFLCSRFMGGCGCCTFLHHLQYLNILGRAACQEK